MLIPWNILYSAAGQAPVKRAALARLAAFDGRGFSSALSEAIAKGFGFKSQAALCAMAKQGNVCIQVDQIDGPAARQSLFDAGFDCPHFLYASVVDALTPGAGERLARAAASVRGLGLYGLYMRGERETFSGPSATDMFRASEALLLRCTGTRSPSHSCRTSYGLKHIAEDQAEVLAPGAGLAHYVANGTTIAALSSMGIRWRADGANAMTGLVWTPHPRNARVLQHHNWQACILHESRLADEVWKCWQQYAAADLSPAAARQWRRAGRMSFVRRGSRLVGSAPFGPVFSTPLAAGRMPVRLDFARTVVRDGVWDEKKVVKFDSDPESICCPWLNSPAAKPGSP